MAEVPTSTMPAEELDKTPVGKALLALRQRMKHLRDHFDELPESVSKPNASAADRVTEARAGEASKSNVI